MNDTRLRLLVQALDEGATDDALLLRGRLAVDDATVPDAVDRRLAAAATHPLPTPEALQARLDQLDEALTLAQEAEPVIDPLAWSHTAAVIEVRDGWCLVALGLETVGADATATRAAVDAIDARIRERGEAGDVFAELAESERSTSPLGSASGWAAFPAPHPPVDLGAPVPDASLLVRDADLQAYHDGTASPLQARLVRSAAAQSATVRDRLAAAAKPPAFRPSQAWRPPPGLPTLPNQRDRLAAAAKPPVFRPNQAWRPPPGLPTLPNQPVALAATGQEVLDDPAPGSLVWGFLDGTTLHVEPTEDGYLVTLLRGTEDGTYLLVGPDGEAWDDGEGGLRLRTRGGEVMATAGDAAYGLQLEPT